MQLATITDFTNDVWYQSYQTAKKYITNYGRGLDVGCRRGDWAQYMVKDFDQVIGWDYRAKSAHHRKLMNKTAGYDFIFHECALGEGEYVSYTNTGVGRIKGVGDQKVNVRSLDSYNLDTVDFIKMDVEGYEPKVIMGGEKLIKRDWPVLCVEINRDDNDSQAILESWGYVLKEIDALQGHDYFFVKEN